MSKAQKIYREFRIAGISKEDARYATIALLNMKGV